MRTYYQEKEHDIQKPFMPYVIQHKIKGLKQTRPCILVLPSPCRLIEACHGIAPGPSKRQQNQETNRARVKVSSCCQEKIQWIHGESAATSPRASASLLLALSRIPGMSLSTPRSIPGMYLTSRRKNPPPSVTASH